MASGRMEASQQVSFSVRMCVEGPHQPYSKALGSVSFDLPRRDCSVVHYKTDTFKAEGNTEKEALDALDKGILGQCMAERKNMPLGSRGCERIGQPKITELPARGAIAQFFYNLFN